MSCLFADDLQDGGRAQVELIEQEVIWVHCLQPGCAERLAREVINVGGHDGLGVRPDGCGDNMPVIVVGQKNPGFEFLPSRDPGLLT